jgi:2-succinyl-6-hydroxy-2,4-cyclohexadiene-1-carboxylate synthase
MHPPSTQKLVSVCEGRAHWPVRVYDGGCGPVVVLLHGFMQSGSTWDAVAAGLSARFRLVVPDMGSVDAPRANLECLADGVHDAACWAAGRFGADSVCLVGYSMGGRVALECLRRFPRFIGAMVLESVGLGPETEEDRFSMAQRNQALARRIANASDMDDVVDYWQDLPLFASQKELPVPVQREVRRQRMACDRDWLSRIVWEAGAQTMPLAVEARDLLRRAAVPVLYIAGRADSKYRSVAASLSAVGVETALLTGGHDVHLEDSVEYTECIAAFFDRAAGLCSNEKDKS